MASSKIKGITIEIGGDTTKLGKAIADSEAKSRSLQGELKQVEKLLKMDPGNVELIAQKQEILTQAVAETTDKLKTLKEAQEQVERQFKDGDIGEDQYRAFQRELIKTESELDDFRSKLNGLDDEIEDVGESAEKSSDGFTIMGGAIADLVSNAIQNAVSAVGDLIGSLLELSEATEEYRTMQAKLEGSSKTFGYSVDFAKEKYEEFYKYLGDDQASTNAITNLMGIGTSTESVSKLAEGATAVWASYGDSIPIEGLTEAINETITVGKVTGGMADTINWAKNANEGLKSALSGNKDAQKAYNDAIKEGLPVEDAFNEALAKITSEQERADVVAKFLNNTYGESKQTYDELNKSVMDTNEAELALKDTQAQLGETMAPVNNALTDMKNQALEAITPLVVALAEGFLNLYTWLKENPVAMQILVGVAIALAGAFTVLAGALAIQGLINGVTTAIGFLNTSLLANPITLIVALIAGLVAGFIYLWNNCDAFREFWINLWDNIKKVTSICVEALKKFFTKTVPDALNALVTWFKSLPEKVRSAISSVVDKAKTVFNNLKTSAVTITTNTVNSVVSWFKQLPEKIRSAIWSAISVIASWGSNMLSKARSAMTNVVNGIANKLREVVSKVKSIGGDVVKGIWNGISDKVGWIKNKISGFKDQIVNSLKSAFGIHSPSRVMKAEIGSYLADGIAEGLTDSDAPKNAVNQVKRDIIGGTEDINGLTLNRRINATFSGGGTAVNNESLLSKLDSIYDRLSRLQIVLDTGTLVGETIDKIDAGLASKQILSARGV